MKAKTPNICGFALSAETLLWMMTWGCRPWLSCRENSPPIAWRAEIRIRSSSGDRIRVATLDLSKMGGELSRMGMGAAGRSKTSRRPVCADDKR